MFYLPALPKLWQAWSGWREVGKAVKNVLGDQDTTYRPMQVVRLLVGVGVNIGLMLFGILDDPNFYYFILIVCLVNMGLYFVNYVLAKVVECILVLLTLYCYWFIFTIPQKFQMEICFYQTEHLWSAIIM